MKSSLNGEPSVFSPMRLGMLCTVRAFLLAVLMGVPSFASAVEVQIADVQLGINGSFKVGRWAPVEFTLTGPEGTKVVPVLRTADPDGNPTLQPLPVVTLTEDPQTIRGLVRSGRLDGSIQILICAEGADLAGEPLKQLSLRVEQGGKWRAFRQSSQFWVTIGKQPLLESGLKKWTSGRGGLVNFQELDENQANFTSATALDSVDVLVLNGDTILSQQSSESIRDWVRGGGRCLFSLGETGDELKDSPLAEWLPLMPQGKVDVLKLTGFNDLVPRSSSLRTLSTLPAASFERSSGKVIAAGLVEPLAVRAASGLGTVTMVAVSLSVPPLLNWEPDSQAQLVSALVGLPSPQQVSESAAIRAEAASELNPSAVTDLQGQLNQSLDHFSMISRPSHWQVMGWIALFALMIGPLDYYVVTHLLKRPEWTWATVIIWSLLASGLALGYANQKNDHSPLSRQIDLLDMDAASHSVIARSWYGFYGNATERLAVTAEPQAALAGTTLNEPHLNVSWLSRPGEGFRGMDRNGGINDSLPSYEFRTDRSGIANFPVEVWSSGAVHSEWTATARDLLPINSNLSISGINRLVGTIEHQLDGEITDWFIAHDHFAYFDRSGENGRAAPLTPGKKWDLSSAGSSLLRGHVLSLVERGFAVADQLDADTSMSRTSYDPLSVDPFRIGVAISFYSLLGGESYTGLQNQSLGRLDVSPLMELSRAVLIGRFSQPASKFQINGTSLPEDNQTTIIRLLLPIQASLRNSDAPPTKDILEYRR